MAVIREVDLRRPIVTAVLAIGLALFAAGPAAAQETYVDAVGDLAGRVQALVTEAQSANTQWDAAEITYGDAIAIMTRLAGEASSIATATATLQPPEQYVVDHAELAAIAGRIEAATAAMLDGLVSTDTGEGRTAAVADLVLEAGAFDSLAAFIQSPGPQATTTTTTNPPTTTTTSTGGTTAETTATTATTATTTTAAAQSEPGDDGGIDLWLVLLVLAVGMALGILAGLFIGRQARLELIAELKLARRARDIDQY